MAYGTLALAALAGVVSTLSPCVLPLLPIVLGASAAEHPLGPAALAAGVAISFATLGLFVATIGFAIGLDAAWHRELGALLFIGLGVLLIVPEVWSRVAAAGGQASNWIEARLGGFSTSGAGGQFALGLLLGTIWAPCVGPTLGAASVLAAQGTDPVQVALTMVLFGLGAALPLVVLGLLSRETMLAWRGRLLGAGTGGKALLGGLLMLVSVLVLTGLDKRIEAVLVEASPAWLTELTTRY
jgi:cytochrome c biogenesis protein CcdA